VDVTLVREPAADPSGASAVDVTRALLAAAGAEISWFEHHLVDGMVPADAIAHARRTGALFVGPHAPRAGVLPPIVQLRPVLGLYANHRPVRSLPGIPSRYEGVDILVIRETTEDIYSRHEHESVPGVFESLKVTTQAACARIARHAFDHAAREGRRRVAIVHKANIMKLSDGMFLRIAREIAEEFPTIETEDVIVDALCMKLVTNPERFDVLLTGNLFGDIVGDLCAGLVGGEGNCPSINLGAGVVVYGTPHGDRPGMPASPITLLHAARVMLRADGQGAAADRLRAALLATLADGVRTPDLGGTASAAAFGAAMERRLTADG
jgi:isocitrate dehydrogenase (NAD+)